MNEGGACRVVDLRAAVAHVVNGCRHVAFGVRYPHETLDAVIFECGGNRIVRTAMLNGFERLSAAVGDSGLAVNESVRHLCHESVGTAVKGVFCTFWSDAPEPFAAIITVVDSVELPT